MDADTASYISQWLDVEVDRKLQTFAPEARRFLEDVLVEAFNTRRGEDQAQAIGMSSYRSVTFTEVSAALETPGNLAEGIRIVINDACERAAESRRDRPMDEGLIIDIVQAAHRHWCRVWPFWHQ